MELPLVLNGFHFWMGFQPIYKFGTFLAIFEPFSHKHRLPHQYAALTVKNEDKTLIFLGDFDIYTQHVAHYEVHQRHFAK